MPFENNGTLQKWHMTNNPPEKDKHEKWHTLRKKVKYYICQGLT